MLLPSVLLLQEHIPRDAADTIPTQRATRAFVAVIERSVTAALSPQRCRCRLPGRQQRAGTARAHRLEAIVLNLRRTTTPQRRIAIVADEARDAATRQRQASHVMAGRVERLSL